MKSIRILILVFYFIPSCIFVNLLFAQPTQQIQNSFNLYRQTAFQEKLYVQTDKNVYLPGEIVWFKIYSIDGNSNKPVNFSKVAYVEIMDKANNPVVQGKIAVKNGSGSGSLYIPVNVNNGTYTFRAYTSWMKNFSPDFYFQKAITLVNPFKTQAVEPKVSPSYDIGFYPEGGHLVSGVEAKIGFKAVASNGMGLNVRGAVVNQANDTVARFASLHFGIGSFIFTPQPANTYRAVVFADGQKAQTVPIKDINNDGTVMRVTDNGSGQLKVMIHVSGESTGGVYLFIHNHQDVKYAETVLLTNGKGEATISKALLGAGISHLTLFNENKQPLCERLYFKKPAQKLSVSATADQQQYVQRNKVSVTIAASAGNNKGISADMSLAVYRTDSLQGENKDDIYSYLWLASDLKGTVEHPEYYFEQHTDAEEAIDNLMLTQGWSKFNWGSLLANRQPAFKFLPEYYGHLITAKLVNTNTNLTAGNILTYLGVPGKRVQLYVAQSDTNGNLTYNTRDFYGPGEIVAQTNQQKDSTYRIDIQNPFSESIGSLKLPEFSFNPGMAGALQEHSLGVQTLNIYTGTQIKQFLNPVKDSSAFFGKPYKTYKLDDFTRFTTMEEDLREYVSEDNIVNSGGRFHIKVLNDRGFLNGDPLVILDGIPVFEINKIFTVDPLKVRKLDVIRERYYYGAADAEGIFSFTTYKGDLGGVELDPKAIVLDYEGMQLQREFYSPVYNTPDQQASRLPDFRTTLYWSPVVGNTATFYTSDLKGKYIGVVQGITKQGDAGSGTFTFEVK